RTQAGVAADPVLAYMSRPELERAIERLKVDMAAAAKRMEFLQAAQFRDEIVRLEARLNNQE
ncbi:MAG: UvrB/UvrC motif-containing protein, partial [Muribaculaceae bacterium]|nr:UvrB/UvrC motif-containing protein [Muribaculaceae bacterium]